MEMTVSDLLATLIIWATFGGGCALFLLMLTFAVVSHREEEPRAVRVSVTLALLLPLPFLAAARIDSPWQIPLCLLLLGVTALAKLLLLFPSGNRFPSIDDTPKKRIDERDTMFSRNSLEEGSPRFEEYYRRRPEHREPDDTFRSYPGLMREGATYYEPVTVAAAAASFRTVAAFHPMLDDEELPLPPRPVDPVRMTRFIRKWIRDRGAVSVGVTPLRDYHLYTVIGRGDRYGEPVELAHKNAIAFTVEMDKAMMDRAPQGPTVMESAQQYLSSGTIAVQVAQFIRQLGYSSRAHIDASYRVVCPLVARDAGLGEIGRMGLLMTPELGPRVRIAVVTTDLPLEPSARKRDATMIDFCRLCKKCADTCPGRAISFEDRGQIGGTLRWQIDSEACFTLWCRIGTDCGRCMSVCPYSHPNNLLHNLMRLGVKQSAPFRKVALKLDDLFYGRHPAPLDPPGWIEGPAERDGKEEPAAFDG